MKPRLIKNVSFFPVILAMILFAALSMADTADGPPVHRQEDIVSRVDVRVDGAGKRTEDLKEFARNLILLEDWRPFSRERLEKSIEALKKTGLFRVIEVPDPLKTPDGLVFKFNLTAYYRIRDIKITGAFPLLERKLLTAMSIYVGDAFIPSNVKKQENRIRDLYVKEGYPEPEVDVTADLGDPEQGVVISVNIVKGRFYHVRRCVIEGCNAFFTLRLKLRTHFYKASFFFGEARRLIQEKLDEDITNLTRFYRARGYPDVKISSETEIVEKDKSADVKIIIDEGPYYILKFRGNRQFWDYTLKKEFDFAGRGNQGNVTLKRGLRAIKEKYRQEGYPDAWVTMDTETVQKKNRKVRTVFITIDEGYRNMVEGIAFTGNHHLEEGMLMKDILSKPPGMFSNGAFVPQVLSDDVDALAGLYRKKGYAHVKVKESVTWETDKDNKIRKAHILFSVDEGERAVIRSITFNGLSGINLKDASKLLSLNEGGVYSGEVMTEDEKKLSNAVTEKGYPNVTVEGRVIFDKDRSNADVVFDVNEGPYVEVGKILFQGNFMTDPVIFEREMDLNEGDYFSLVKYLEAQKNMRDINAISAVDFKEFGLKEKEPRVNILTSVEEKKPYYFQTAIGYDTSQHRYVNAKIGDRNLFGLNKEAWISQELSDIGHRTETGVTEPRFLGTKISATVNLYAEKLAELNKNYGNVTYGSTLNLSREYSSHVTSALAFTYKFTDKYMKDGTEVSDEEKNTNDGRHMFITSPSISYNTTDSFIRPKKGIYSIFSVDFSSALGNKYDDFLRYQLQARYYYSPISFLTLALRARYGYLKPIAVDGIIPDDQLFYLGGATDVRGFDENLLRFDSEGSPVGGREFFMGSVETRIDLGLNLEMTCFYDAGRVGRTNSGEGDGGVRAAVGTGLRYVTPIGPVGFLYGWKIARKPGEASGNLHFTIGYSF